MTGTENIPFQFRNWSPSKVSKSKLVVAIDFGTTFTGVAYAHSTTNLLTAGSTLTPEQIRDKITVVRNWPNVQSTYAEKVPSIVAYENSRLIAWGARVKPTHSTQVSHFKLGLQDGARDHYGNSETDESSLGGFLLDPNWKHPLLPDLRPLDYATDYLREVRKYIIDHVFPRDFGQSFLDHQQIKYVLTVPAIWNDKAKDLSRRAAVNAGFTEDDLTMVTEPEAAALYCSTLCHEVNLNNGDCFLICDAGGGTVVCFRSINGANSSGSHLLSTCYPTSVPS
jgi:molecular chaperone DnaK (HSP70)